MNKTNVSDNVKSIQPIIDKLSEAARRNEVSGWESGGEALYHYIYVCDEVLYVIVKYIMSAYSRI